MPKRLPRNKNFRPPLQAPRAYGQRGPFIVKDLLAKAGITSKGAAQHAEQQSKWLARLHEVLPPELHEHITGASFDAGTLTVHAATAAWSARLRYALAERLPALRELEGGTLTRVSVRLRSTPPRAD